jgi:2-haloacid dehalogenase
MKTNRRQFLRQLAAAAAMTSAPPLARPARAAASRKVKAIAFDAFPIFDPRPLAGVAERLFPGKGAQLGNAWRTRQFEYQWLRVLSGHYADFWQTTEEALVFAARALRLELTPNKRAELMQAFLRLGAWPDVLPALRALRQSGLRLALLSNWTASMLDAGIRNAGLEGMFEHVLSTDRIASHKPDPRAYQMGLDAFGLEREEVLFAAFAGWDVAGAKWFGYPTFWVNRLDFPAEELGVVADAAGRNLADLAAFVRNKA